jgi:hypothetical protein
MAPLAFSLPGLAYAVHPFDFSRLRSGYLERLSGIQRSGTIPIIDIESSYNPLNIDLASFTQAMDRAGIAMMCLSVDQPGRAVSQGDIWSDHALEAAEKYPTHFIPTGNGGNHPAWTKLPDKFLAAQEQFIQEHRYPLMGELEVRHYPSPRQVQRGETHRDVDIAIDGPLMERVFSFSEKTGIPFQIHYEIEDRLLEPFERMLTRYPKAKVIWCHLAQVRYSQRSTRYSPNMLAQWLNQYPQLYIDTAFGDALSNYPLSGERHARYWGNSKEWADLIASNPYRFLAALDIGGDRMNRIEEWTRNLRNFLGTLPSHVREIVAYKSAWKLLFHEEI